MELQAEQERLLRRLGAPPEPRKYTPHVTLARLRGAAPSAVAAISARAAIPVAEIRGDALRALFFARFGGRRPYIIEAEYPLGRVELMAARAAHDFSGSFVLDFAGACGSPRRSARARDLSPRLRR